MTITFDLGHHRDIVRHGNGGWYLTANVTILTPKSNHQLSAKNLFLVYIINIPMQSNNFLYKLDEFTECQRFFAGVSSLSFISDGGSSDGYQLHGNGA